MFEKSDSIAKLAEALSKAQGEIEGAKKDSSNPFFKSNYADLGSVWEACRQPLAKNGLSVAQLPAESNGGVTLITILMHSSGEYIKSQYSVPCKPDAQSVGSAITYMRRYALAAAVGIYAEDDDGNAASQTAPKQASKPAPPPAPKHPTPPAEPVVPMSQQAPAAEPAQATLPAAPVEKVLVADIIKELISEYPGLTIAEGLNAINSTDFMGDKSEVSTQTKISKTAGDTIKGQVKARFDHAESESSETYTSHYNDIKKG